MRDRHFVAMHRGGVLDMNRHRLLAFWAADCAEHVLPLFEAFSSDDRPRHAIQIAREWSRGQVPVGAARKASVAAHAAAREVDDASARAAARAAGQAVATAHMADHCLRASLYAVKAVESSGHSGEVECTWQIDQLPDEIREMVVSALETRKKEGRNGNP